MRSTRSQTFSLVAAALAGISLALLGGCATAPKRQLAEAKADVAAAEALAAEDNPQAAYHLSLARKQIKTAEQWMKDGTRSQERRAELLLRRAESDAELAQSFAQRKQLVDEEQRAWTEVRRLEAGME
jgi:hypothetical protein